ncbi:MAG: acetate kinase [Planctomycetes bacterium]|nr:acetate kinase [Planctomycetota bacterium]
MKILVINTGSSSLKYQVFEQDNQGLLTCLAQGLVERIGISGSKIHQKTSDGRRIEETVEATNHTQAIELLNKALIDPMNGVLKEIAEIRGVGHRVVHGADKFMKSMVIDEAVLQAIEECCSLAPLHNPPNLLGIRACQAMLPGIPQVAVFDTAFHQTMPPRAYLYGLPREYIEKYGIRRYGFHGSSHRYVSRQVPGILGKSAESLKFVTCHLGNGSSLAAVQGGDSVDTSMGLTPLEGVMMGTRCGDIDPAIVLFLQEAAGLSRKETDQLLNKKSGLLGLCGRSDMRDIEEAAESGDEPAQQALEVFVYRIVKKIGAYAAAMNGLDALVFTAGIGENSPVIRKMVAKHFTFLGMEIDSAANNANKQVVSTASSKVAILVVPTNEELLIAQDTVKLI